MHVHRRAGADRGHRARAAGEEAAARPGFFVAILDHIAGHEPDLLAFAAEAGLKPESVMTARRALAGPYDWTG